MSTLRICIILVTMTGFLTVASAPVWAMQLQAARTIQKRTRTMGTSSRSQLRRNSTSGNIDNVAQRRRRRIDAQDVVDPQKNADRADQYGNAVDAFAGEGGDMLQRNAAAQAVRTKQFKPSSGSVMKAKSGKAGGGNSALAAMGAGAAAGGAVYSSEDGAYLPAMGKHRGEGGGDGEEIDAFLDSVGEVVESTTEVVGDVAGGTVDVVGDVVGGTAGVVGGVVGGTAEVVGSVAGGTVDVVGDVAGGTVDVVGDVVGGTAEVVGGVVGGTAEVVGDVLEGAGDFFEEVLED